MEHIAALLLIVGCSADLSECRELPAPVSVFETHEECQALLPASLDRFRSAEPRVAASCVFVDPADEEEDAELVWSVTPDGALVAEIVSGALVAHEDAAQGQVDAF